MTYIIAGRLENKTFMMSDCIVTNSQTSRQSFIYKTLKLDSSSNTFYSFTGIQFIDNCVRAYDYWLKSKSLTNDFCFGDNSMKELQQVIVQMLKSFSGNINMKLGYNRLFFISTTNAVYYDLDYTQENKLATDPQRIDIPSGYYITSVIDSKLKTIELHTQDLKQYCKDQFTVMTRGQIDFKDRFSFACIENGKVTFHDAFKHFSDFIAMYNELDFGSIDDSTFIWNISD